MQGGYVIKQNLIEGKRSKVNNIQWEKEDLHQLFFYDIIYFKESCKGAFVSFDFVLETMFVFLFVMHCCFAYTNSGYVLLRSTSDVQSCGYVFGEWICVYIVCICV
jgi:hypothetical protein